MNLDRTSPSTVAMPPDSAKPSAPRVIWVLTAAMMLLTATWSLLTPQFLAPDESAHFASSVRLSEGFSWPDPATARFPASVEAAGEEARVPHSHRSTLSDLDRAHPGEGDRFDQMTQHPPLYYILTGGALATPGVGELVWDQAMLIARLVGALLAAPLVWLTWNTVTSLTKSSRMGTVAAFSIFAVPQLPQTMGVVTNDSLAILAAWATTWLAVKILCGDRRWPQIVGLGVAFGFGCLVKGTVLPLGILLLLVLLLGAGGEKWSRRLAQTAVALAVAFVTGGWWWARNVLLFGTLQPDGLVQDPGAPPANGPSVGHYIDEVWSTTPTTFWGWFGRVNVPLPELLVDVLTISCALVVIVGTFRSRETLRSSAVLAAPVILATVLFVRTSWVAYEDTGAVRGLHGRYFFPVLLAIVAIAAIAAANIMVTRSARRAFGHAVVGGAAALTITGLGVAFLGFYAGNAYGNWRVGLDVWLHSYSPVPSVVTLGVPFVALASLALAIVMYLRSEGTADVAHRRAPISRG